MQRRMRRIIRATLESLTFERPEKKIMYFDANELHHHFFFVSTVSKSVDIDIYMKAAK